MLSDSEQMKILIVDDNQDNVDLMAQMLEDYHTIVTAYSGEEGIEKACSEKPDLILLDVNMPGMDGYETIQRLRALAECQDIPVIFASAYYTESPMIVKGLGMGAFDYMAKPIDEDILLAKVQVVHRVKQAEERLVRSQKMEALGQLTGGLAHDYNNMLGVILGYTELMEDYVGDDHEFQEYLREIRNAGIRGAKLTQRLLAFAKQKESDQRVLILNTLLAEEEDMLTKTLTARIKLEYHLAEDLWSTLLDPHELEDAILNMAINAMHAIEGNGTLRMETENRSLSESEAEKESLIAGDYVLLHIADTGCGMDKKTISRIFEPFFTTKGDEGTGLGLSQVYGFAKRSGGGISVRSEPGEGTRFTLYFPRFRQNAQDEQGSSNRNVEELSGAETVLVVDDEPVLASLATKMLKRKGYRSIEARSAAEALKILESEPVDLLVSDVIMPEIGGYQLAELVKERFPDVKILLTTGYSQTRGLNAQDRELEGNLLRKPYAATSLLRKVRELLDGKASDGSA